MKNVLLIFFLLLSFSSYSQKLEVDKITGIYTLTGIAEIDGVNKEQIFDEIYRYIVLNYSNINNVIIQTNGNVYSIYAKVSQTASNWYKGELTYKLFIEIKDDKFRYTFSNFILNGISFEQKVLLNKASEIERTEFDLGNLLIRLNDVCRNPVNW